jgi:hypothetical protein
MNLPEHDRERALFQEAYVVLLDRLDAKTRELVSSDFNNGADRQARGEPFEMGVMGAFAIRTILMHMFQGSPLEIPAIVAEALCEAGERIETPLADCAGCGYSLPRTFSACPLCGGPVGLAFYALQRAPVEWIC